MNKHFIKVSKTYGSKNKLHEVILDKMQALDHTLCGSQGAAVHLINTAYEEARKSYEGKASVPSLHSFESNEHTAVFYVTEVIYIAVHEVVNEVNVNKF